MSRHPCTNACDFIRNAAAPFDADYSAKVITRAQASTIRHAIADAIGMPDGELAEKLSLAFQAGRPVMTEA